MITEGGHSSQRGNSCRFESNLRTPQGATGGAARGSGRRDLLPGPGVPVNQVADAGHLAPNGIFL